MSNLGAFLAAHRKLLAAIGGALASLATTQVPSAHWLPPVIATLTAALVYQLPNSSPKPVAPEVSKP